MAPKSANAHEAQVSPPTQVQHQNHPFISNLAKATNQNIFENGMKVLTGVSLTGKVMMESDEGLEVSW